MTREEKQLRSFGKMIATIRKSRNLTQEQLSQKLDMSHTALGRIETGQRWPRLATLYRMADALNVSVVDFFEHTRK